MLFNQFNKLQGEENKETIINSNSALNNLINSFYFEKFEQRNENRKNFLQKKNPLQKLTEILQIIQNKNKLMRPGSIENKKNIQNFYGNPLLSCRKIISSANVKIHSKNFYKQNNQRNNVVISNFIIPNAQDNNNTSTLKTFNRMNSSK